MFQDDLIAIMKKSEIKSFTFSSDRVPIFDIEKLSESELAFKCTLFFTFIFTIFITFLTLNYVIIYPLLIIFASMLTFLFFITCFRVKRKTYKVKACLNDAYSDVYIVKQLNDSLLDQEEFFRLSNSEQKRFLKALETEVDLAFEKRKAKSANLDVLGKIKMKQQAYAEIEGL